MGKEKEKSMHTMASIQHVEAVTPHYEMPPFRRGRTPWNRLGSANHGRIPRVEIIEQDQEIILRAEVPGVNMVDLEYSIAGNIVTIQGKSRHENQGNKAYYHYSEISRDAFARDVVLPEYVDSIYSKAKLLNGVLELRLLKTEQA